MTNAICKERSESFDCKDKGSKGKAIRGNFHRSIEQIQRASVSFKYNKLSNCQLTFIDDLPVDNRACLMTIVPLQGKKQNQTDARIIVQKARFKDFFRGNFHRSIERSNQRTSDQYY